METISKIKETIKYLNNLLNQKLEILNQILNISENQKMFLNQLDDEISLNSYILESLKEKQNLINNLKIIDENFIKTFESFNGELNKNKDFFKEDIKSMQNKIQQITELDIKIRIQEEINKPLFQNAGKNKPIKTLKANKSYILQKYSENTKK